MPVKIGLIGTGTVGGGCIDIILKHRDDFKRHYGIDIELVGTMQKKITGFDAALVFNLTETESCGLNVVGGVNMAKTAYGCQIAGVFNYTDELHGCQIALVNFARECPWGFQIGLVNIIMDNKIKVLPIVNGYF